MPPDHEPGRDLELAVLRLAWRLDAIDRWREETVKQLAACEESIENLAESDRIAEAVAEAIRQEPPTPQRIAAGLTTWQRLGAFAAGALVLADAVRGLVGA